MAWITPVIDRAQSDVDNKTAKGFMNVSDWNRIHGNIDHVKTYLDANNYITGSLLTMLTATVSSIPTFGNVNNQNQNINLLVDWAYLDETSLGISNLKHDYIGGANQVAPDFEDVNLWEETLGIIWDTVQKAVDFRVFCGVGATGQPRLWQNRFR